LKVAVLIASRNRPDLVEAAVRYFGESVTTPHDLYVVECGTDTDKLSPHSTLWYADPEFKGKLYGHALALEAARAAGTYDYYFVMMNDAVFEPGVDVLRVLIDQLEHEPRMAILSPTNSDGGYPGSAKQRSHGWRAVTTCDYLAFLMRASALDEVGFLNPQFQYCWGAIHELSYKLYRAGWFVAYSDAISYEHLGGSTYGQPGTRTISREDYQQRAKRFAFDYFRRRHGDNWDEIFWEATAGHDIAINTFAEHKRLWASAYGEAELRELGYDPKRVGASSKDVGGARTQPNTARLGARRDGVKLHLGCGPEKRPGWINIDANASAAPDIVGSVEALPQFETASVDAIEACHLFEHLTYTQAKSALVEWARVLKPGGELLLELPDFEACVRILGKHRDERGFDLGLIGIFGWPPAIDEEGVPQIHKWGWTRTSLAEALREAGFEQVEFGPITQTWRIAAKVGRDMRLRAVRTSAAVTSNTTAARVQGASAPKRGAAAPSAATKPALASAPASAPQPDIYPLATAAQYRVFAWPNWTDARELSFLLNAAGRLLVGRTDACLCLRRDPRLDPPEEVVVTALQAAHARTLGEGRGIEVLLVDDAIEPADWPALARAIDGAFTLPSSKGGERATLYAALGTKVVHSLDALSAALGAQTAPPATVYSKDVLDSVDWDVVARIKELHPWFYPVTLGNLQVTPGVGAHVAPEYLANRVRNRATILVDEVSKSLDLRGKSVLELACNCGFWSARYAERGAARVVGMEGREKYVEQARLYWSTNKFLPADDYTFLHGDIADPAAWAKLRELGHFDIVLCAGILYHVPNPGEILGWAAELAREALIVDTRVTDGPETLVDEPGELHFNAIEATRRKVTPNRAKLLQRMRELGLDPHVLPVGFGATLGVDADDSYAEGRRITVLGRVLQGASRDSTASARNGSSSARRPN
jgi:SAM-dependent methyltransferase